jgi:hypothetical protein
MSRTVTSDGPVHRIEITCADDPPILVDGCLTRNNDKIVNSGRTSGVLAPKSCHMDEAHESRARACWLRSREVTRPITHLVDGAGGRDL